jgi:hypothetical protein
VSGRVFWRTQAVWLLIIAGESILGTLRTLLLEPPLGPDAARWVAFPVSLAWIALAVWLTIRWIGAKETWTLLGIGVLWAMLTLLFEIALGRFALSLSWAEIFVDYDLSRGRLMSLGLLLMALAPWGMARLRQMR